MKKLFALTLIILISGCGKWTSLRFGEDDGGLLPPNAPIVKLLAVTQEKVTIKGLNLAGVTGIKFAVPAKDNKLSEKEFKVTSASFTELVAVGIDAIQIPTNMLLDMVLTTAQAQTSFPIYFTLQDDSIDSGSIQDGAVTRLKLNKEETDTPTNGQILKWDAGTNTFIFADESGNPGLPGGGVEEVIRGRGIFGDGTSITTTGTIAVDVGVTGDATYTKIPFFNNTNQLVLDSNINNTKLLFKGPNEISMYNDGALRFIDEGAPLDIMILNPGGDVSISKDLQIGGTSLTVGGTEVCLADGTNCLTSGITNILTQAPILGGGSSATVTISLDVGTGVGQAVQLVDVGGNGALPIVDGSNLTGIVKGPGTSTSGNITSFSDGTGNQLADSGVAAQLVLDNQTAIGSLQASNTGFDTRITQNSTNIATNAGDISSLDGRVTQNELDIASMEASNTGFDLRITQNETDIDSLQASSVTGPASSTDFNLAAFDGATGKIIKDSGLSSTGLGDVKGPATSTQFNISTFADTTGKLIEDSGVSINTLVQSPATSTVDNFAVFSDGSGNIKDSNINISEMVKGPGTAASNTVALFDGTGNVLTKTQYIFPINDGSNGQVLTTDGGGEATWETITTGTGDVSGPASSTQFHLASYADGSGKVIGDSGVPFSQITDNTSAILVNTADIATNTVAISGLDASNTDFNVRITKNENDITTLNTDVAAIISVPVDGSKTGEILTSSGTNNPVWLADGDPGEFLTTDGAGTVSWQPISGAGVGDVTGPASSTNFNLAAFDGVTGKLIRDGGVNVNELLKSNVSATATNKFAIYSDLSGKNLIDSEFSVPSGVGIANQVLTTDGSGGTAWSTANVGNVIGPASSTQFSLALFADTNGDVLTGSSYVFPLTDGETNQVLITDGANNITWGNGISVINEWEPNKDYKKQDVAISSTNYLVKALNDYTSDSTSPFEDLKNGNSEIISPPGFSTGVLEGGKVTLSGTTASVAAGQGVIVDYTDSLIPTFTWVSWDATSVNLSGAVSDWTTVFVNSSGTVSTQPNFPSAEFEYTNITLAVINTEIGEVAPISTFVTDPVSQIRDLSTFLGLIFKDLNFIGNSDKTLNRDPYSVHSWGADADNGGITPNINNFPTDNIVAHYYADRNGLLPGGPVNLVDTSQWDNNGTVQDLGNNRFGYQRIYLTYEGKQIHLYSQDQYRNETEAIAAIEFERNTLIVPEGLLSAAKWVGNIVYEKDEINLKDNFIQSCNLFGCGSGGGGSIAGSGGGNVFGPPIASDNAVALFDETSGKIIKATSYRFPQANGTANQILQTDGLAGNVTWTDPSDFLSSTDAVTGPASSASNTVALFADGTGKVIAATDYTLPITDGSNGQVLITNGSGVLSWGTIPTSGVLEYPYEFKTSQNPNTINNGEIKLNEATPQVTTILYVHKNDNNLFGGTDRSARWLSLTAGDFVQLIGRTDSSINYSFEVAGDPVIPSGEDYIEVPVTYYDHSGVLTDTLSINGTLLYQNKSNKVKNEKLGNELQEEKEKNKKYREKIDILEDRIERLEQLILSKN